MPPGFSVFSGYRENTHAERARACPKLPEFNYALAKYPGVYPPLTASVCVFVSFRCFNCFHVCMHCTLVRTGHMSRL